jgi:hypothetical protein
MKLKTHFFAFRATRVAGGGKQVLGAAASWTLGPDWRGTILPLGAARSVFAAGFLLCLGALNAFSSSVALTSSANPSTYGQSVTLTAAVSPSTATGTVTFYNGVTVLETEPISSGQAALKTVMLPSGTLSILARYNGDGIDLPSISAPFQQTVDAVAGNGFNPAVNYPAGSFPLYMAAGDFNGDGKVDLAVATDLNSSDISILLGNGDGTFQAPVSYATGENVYWVAVGDFNGDGIPDLVIAGSSLTAEYWGLAVLIGNGDGTFQTPTTYFAPPSYMPLTVAVADFNGDGIADLVALSQLTSEVGNVLATVYLGNGDGTFQSPKNTNTSFPAGSAYSLGVGDLNGDGIPDLALLGYSTLEIFIGNGDGTFKTGLSSSITSAAYPFVVADLNGDGYTDLAFSTATGVSVLLGNGNGTFQAASSYGSFLLPRMLVTADFNGDGTPDIAVDSWNTATAPDSIASVLLGNGGGTLQNPVSYSVGDNSYGVVTADFNGDGRADLAIANSGGNNVSILLAKAPTRLPQTINFGPLANEVFGAAPFTVSATATSGLAVSFAPTTPGICSVSGATVTLGSVGTCTIQATQGGNATYAAATPVNQSFLITQGSQTITFGALSNQAFGTAPFPVSATATSGLAVSFAPTTTGVCSVSGATVTLVAVGTCTIQATQAGNTNWAPAAAVNQSFQVTQGSQTISFGPLSNQAFGAAPFMVSATASSGLAVNFASITPGICRVSGATVTLVAVGACTIRATQPGNTNYAAAAPVNQSFQVTQGSQTISFGSLPSQLLGAAPFTVSATASSGLTVHFTSRTPPVCTVSGTTVTLVAVGTCTITATQPGNADYAAATPVNQSFLVKESQTIAFGSLANRTLGSPPFTVGATASSGLTVSFNSQTPHVCTVSGTTVTLAAVGVCTIQATQRGSAVWAAATPVDQSFHVAQ